MNYLHQLLLAIRHETRMILRSWPFRIAAFICFVAGAFQMLGMISLIYFVSADSYLGPMFAGTSIIFLSLQQLSQLLGFLVLFFASDVGCRDKRVGVSDVIGSRPMTEVQHVIARFLSVTLPLIVLMAATIGLSIAVNKTLGFRTTPFRDYAPFFVCFCALSVALYAALAAFISTMIRHRLFSSLVALVLSLVSTFYLMRFNDVFDVADMSLSRGAYSELAGFAITGQMALKKLMHLCVTLCFLAGAIFFYPRPEAVRRRLSTVVAFVVLLGVTAALATYYASAARGVSTDRYAWREALTSATGNRAAAIDHYEINIEIQPRKGRLHATAATTLRNREESAQDTFIFTLNPGLVIEDVSADDGQAVTVERRGPVVELSLATPLGAGETLDLAWDYGGAIDPRAAWLADILAPENWQEGNLMGADIMLGQDSGLIGDRFCFLLPESHWYPVPGSTFGYEYPDKAPTNFATARIQLELPAGWTGVTQGALTEEKTGGEGATLVFETDTPVPQFSLCAGEYEEVRTEVEGVEFAFYYAPLHRQNVDFFADATEEIERVIGESLRHISDELHLDYPYPRLSVVEVPSSCRTFSDTLDGRNLLVQPGVMLLRETDFFSTFFAQSHKRSEERTKQEGTGATPAQIKVELLKRYFQSNEFGGDLELNLIPMLWEFQIDPSGPAYPALGTAFTAVLSERALGRRPRTANYVRVRTLQPAPQSFGAPEGVEIRTGMGLSTTTWRDYSQEELLLPLGTITPSAQGNRFNELMNWKTSGLWATLATVLGDEAWSSFVLELLDEYRFRPITLEDVEREVAKRSTEDVAWVFDQFVTEPVVPGYVITHAEAYEIDGDERERRFQAILRVANIEEGRGFVQLRIETEGPEESNTVEKEVLFGSREEKEIRMVLREKPKSVRVIPICARNVVEPFETLYVDEKRREVEGEDSIRVLPAEDRAVAIIVDDLDDGFSLVNLEEDSRMRLTGAKGEDTPRAIPDYSGWGAPRRWNHEKTEEAYGKYQRTRKVKRRGHGGEQAVWSADLPEDGVYEVFFYTEPASRGRYTIQVEAGASSQEVVLELADAKSGWNSLGKYTFEKDATARVTLSDEVGGGSRYARVYADAVRWVLQTLSDEAS